MAGHVYKDDKTGKWGFVLENGKNAGGGRKRIRRCTFSKKGEAQEALHEMIEQLKKINSPEECNMTVEEYLDYWLENYAKTSTRPKTFAEYEKLVNTHIKPSLGHIMLKGLKSTHLQSYYTEKLKSLSAQSVLHHHSLISKALNDAIGWEFISKNVAKGAKAPKPEEIEMKTLTVDQLNLLLKTAKETSSTYFPIINAATHTGMRKSELIGLNWNSVNLDAQRLYVKNTITDSGGKYFFNKTPKGKKARGVSLTPEFTEFLKELKIEHDQRKKVLGDTYNPYNLVFCNSVGNIMAPSEVSRALKRALKKANLPNIRFHDLRHSHATMLLEDNVQAKVISARLGHSRINTTMDTYTHVVDKLEQLAVASIEKLLESHETQK